MQIAPITGVLGITNNKVLWLARVIIILWNFFGVVE